MRNRSFSARFASVFRSIPPPLCTGFLSISRLVNLAKRSCAGRYFSCDSPIKTSRMLHSSVIKRVRGLNLSGWSVRVTVSDGTMVDPWPLRGHDPVQGDAARKGWRWKKESVCVWNVCQVSLSLSHTHTSCECCGSVRRINPLRDGSVQCVRGVLTPWPLRVESEATGENHEKRRHMTSCCVCVCVCSVKSPYRWLKSHDYLIPW